MNAKPDPAPTAGDDGTGSDGTGSDGTAEPVILGAAEFTAAVLNGEIDPDEWDEI
jgi:hypothetical protein